MWRSKKFIIVMVLAAVVAAGSIGGIALAQEDEGESPTTKLGEFMERVCAIYEDNTGIAIDQEALREAIAQAGEARCTDCSWAGRSWHAPWLRQTWWV
jgi:hypothetical protein